MVFVFKTVNSRRVTAGIKFYLSFAEEPAAAYVKFEIQRPLQDSGPES